MSIQRKELFDVLINANHFNQENDQVELSISPSEFASRLDILNVADKTTIENQLSSLGYNLSGSYGEGGTLGAPTEVSTTQNIVTTFNIVDNDTTDTPDIVPTGSLQTIVNNGIFSADPNDPSAQYTVVYNFGYDLFSYVVKQLISGTRGIIELKAGINEDIVFYNIGNDVSIADIFSNEIANTEGPPPPGGFGGNLKYIRTVAEPYTNYAVGTTTGGLGGSQEFNTSYGFGASNLGGNSTFALNNTIQRNQKYTIKVGSDTTIDYRAFQARTNGVLDNPVVVNLRQKGNPTHGTDLELFHDKSDYTGGIKTLTIEEWKSIGEPSTNLVRYNWDSIKYYIQFLLKSNSPHVKIMEFINGKYFAFNNPPDTFARFRCTTTSNAAGTRQTVQVDGTNVPTRNERNLYLFYKQLHLLQGLQIPGAIGSGGPGGINEPYQLRNYWDILNLGIALPSNYGGKEYAETLTMFDRWFIRNPIATFASDEARDLIEQGTSLVMTQPKFIAPGLQSLDDDSYWDEKDAIPLDVTQVGQGTLVTAEDPGGELGTLDASQLGIKTPNEINTIAYSVPYVFSRNNRKLREGTQVRFNPIIATEELASVGYEEPNFELNANFIKETGIVEDTTPLCTWHTPDEEIFEDSRPSGFVGITKSPHLFVYREMFNFAGFESPQFNQFDFQYSNLYLFGTYSNLFNGVYGALNEVRNTVEPTSSIGFPLIDNDVGANYPLGTPNGIGPRAIFDREATSIWQTDGVYTGANTQDNGRQLAGRFIVQEVENISGYDDRDVALSVILFDYVHRYIREPGNIQIRYANTIITDALQGYSTSARFLAGPNPALVQVSFPNSIIQDIEIPLTVNNTTSDNITEKVIKTSNVAKDFSQNLFGGSFNYKLSTTLDDETSDDTDSPFFNRIIPNLLNDLYSHGLDSSCLSFPYQKGHALTGGELIKTVRTYRRANSKDDIYTNENYISTAKLAGFYTNDYASYHPHRATPLSNDLIAGGYRGNRKRSVNVAAFKENDVYFSNVDSLSSFLPTEDQPLVQRKFRIRNISNEPGQTLAPQVTNANFSPIDHRSTYAVMFNTDVLPVKGDTYTFSCKVRVSEGFRVTMGVRKYSVDPNSVELQLLETIRQESGSIANWFDKPLGENGGRDVYSDDSRVDYDNKTLLQTRYVAERKGLDAIPNEIQPLEYLMNSKLLDNMHEAGPQNQINQITGYTFSGYNNVVQSRIQDSFIVHTTSPIGTLPESYNTTTSRSGKVDPLYVTFKQTDAVYVRKVGTKKAPVGLLGSSLDGTAQANSENNWGYQAGGLQILFYIHFDTDWYRENISLENDDFYEYLRDRRLEFEIIEPKLSGQDEYKEGPYINQPRIGPTIWTDTTAFNPNKGGYIPQESVYADYGIRYRLYIRNDPIIPGVVLNSTGFFGDINRGVNSVNSIGDYVQNISRLQDEGLTHTYDDNGDYILQLVADDTYGNRHSIENPTTVSNIIKAIRSIDIVTTGSNYDVGYVPYNGLDVPFETAVTSSEFYELENDLDKRETLGVFSFDDEQSNLFQAVDNAPWIYNPLYSNAVFNTTTDANGNVVPDETNPKQDIYIDESTSTTRLVPRWLPECDVRPFENLQKGILNGTLFRYNDPDIDPDIVDITTAPTTVNFFFYRRREFVDFGPASTDPQKQIFDDSITESGFTTLWQSRSVVQGVNNIINPYGRKTTSRWTDQESGGETYWYFTASGSGGYFGPSGSNHMGFPDPLDIDDSELPDYETFISNIDWGDGTVSERERFRNKPQKLSAETIISHTYTKPGVHKVTGCMWDMRKDTNEEGGVYTDIRNVRKFVIKFHLNGNPARDSSLLLNNVPTVLVSGVSNASIYNKSLEAFIGYIAPTETDDASFLPYPFKYHYDKVSSAAAAATVDEDYINPDLLTPYSSERYLLRTVTAGSASYGGTKIMNGLFKNFGSLGDYIGDTDIAQTRIFTQPYRIVDHLGFPNNSVTREEASIPSNKKYWNNIIPKGYLFTNRIGVSSTTVAGKLVISIDSSSNQQWENNYMYPALPLLNEFGQFDEALGLPTGSVLYGQKNTWEGNDTISYITKEVVNDNQLRLDAQLHEIDDNKLLDTAGEGIVIRPISDYKIGVDLRTNEIEFNEPLYGTTTDNDEKAY